MLSQALMSRSMDMQTDDHGSMTLCLATKLHRISTVLSIPDYSPSQTPPFRLFHRLLLCWKAFRPYFTLHQISHSISWARRDLLVGTWFLLRRCSGSEGHFFLVIKRSRFSFESFAYFLTNQIFTRMKVSNTACAPVPATNNYSKSQKSHNEEPLASLLLSVATKENVLQFGADDRTSGDQLPSLPSSGSRPGTLYIVLQIDSGWTELPLYCNGFMN